MNDAAYEAVPVAVYADRRLDAQADHVVFDNLGWGVICEVEGVPFRLWTAAYALENGSRGPWPFDSAAACQTTLIIGNDAEASEDDNPFIHAGWDPVDLLPSSGLDISVQRERAVWTVGGREFVNAPHRWFVRGEHAGVSVDLEFRQTAPPYWYRRPSTLDPPAELWLNQFATASGTVSVRGRRSYEIDGYGWQEHHTHIRKNLDPLTMNRGDGLLFIASFGVDISVYSHLRPDLSEGHVVIRHGNDVIEFDGSQVEIGYEDWWQDPRSWFRVPRTFVLRASGDAGEFSLVTNCRERAYYAWPYRDGLAHQYWFVAISQCRLDMPGVRPESLQLDSMVNLNRAFYRRSVPEPEP